MAKNNNNCTVEVIKKNLNDLLIQIEHAKKTTGSKKSYICIKDTIPPFIPSEKLEIWDVATGMLTDLIEHFRSVDLSSVKMLRKTELFFLHNYELKKFTFPSYASQINPLLIDCANLEIAIDAFDIKALNLFERGHDEAAKKANRVVNAVRLLIKVYTENKDEKSNQINRALGEINEATPILEQHRGWKKLIANLILLITTLGTAHMCNKIFNNHYIFFRETESAKQLNRIEQNVSNLRAY